MTGTLVTTSGQVGGTAISAAKDSDAERAVAVIGDINGYTGSASVTFDGLASTPWLATEGSVHVTVERMPEQAPLEAPQVVFEQDMSVSGGSITVPLTFQRSTDAYAVYLTPGGGAGDGSGEVRAIGADKCLDVPSQSTEAGTGVQLWDCWGGANQDWTHTAAGELSVYSGAS